MVDPEVMKQTQQSYCSMADRIRENRNGFPPYQGFGRSDSYVSEAIEYLRSGLEGSAACAAGLADAIGVVTATVQNQDEESRESFKNGKLEVTLNNEQYDNFKKGMRK